MSYLWDKNGEGDPDLKALEERLGGARYQKKVSVPARARRWPIAVGVALAAGLVAFMLVPRGPAVNVTTPSGGASRLAVGRWLETTEPSVIAMPDIGHVTVAASSKVRVVETTKQLQRLELAKGQLHAKVNAPPRLFVVDTPAASAVDLGCEYDLSVEASGGTLLAVTVGEVSLEGSGVASRVSAGAVCHTQSGKPPGVPRSAHASPTFVAALDAYEQGGPVEPVIAAATDGDFVSLWNLLARVPREARGTVLDRFPVSPDREALLALEPKAMEALWQSFP